eukprot:CAMPEP_0174942258 /NCGR_PEP_ID=MMETSP1355-20121228/73817_1 /TAXON_ID=464990 /ORGANISM="Hemiselmis tepida, Strain CCMP443" /LENGTH=80 /DNA_ID=CAMNT_0016189421 /DNA_START=6 /DNA_END=245 /DNA_ORIENTATION=+
MAGVWASGFGTTSEFGGRVVRGYPEDGCEDLSNHAEVRGNVALLVRGTCTFVDKARRAAAAGATALIVADNTAGPVVKMA